VEHAPRFNQADKIRAGSSRGRFQPLSAPFLSHTHLPLHESSSQNLMPLKVLNGSFVFLCLCLCSERAEISSFARLRIFLARIQSILTGFQFPYHKDFFALCGTPMQICLRASQP
jgi:hypothetical protein